MIHYVAEELGYSALGHNGILVMERQILLRNLHPQVQSINDFELYGVICHFLLEIGRVMDVDIQSDDLLVESLISHVKGMNNWNDADYDWDIGYETSGEFPRIRKLAEDKFRILEKYLQCSLTPKMKDTMTTRQVEASKGCFDQVDFVISTVPIQDCVLPVAVVSPLLTVEDINKIQNLAFKQKKTVLPDARSRFPVLSKIYALYDSGDRRKIEYLDRELKQILEDAFYVESKIGKEFALLNMLKIKYIKARDGKMAWREAIKAASEDLIRDGYFDERYVREAIGNVEEYSSYIIVNKGIALAHARKESGVYEDGLSLLVSKDGIMLDEGETVHLLFFFSQKDETDYLDLFKEIIKLGKDQNDVDRIRNLTDGMEIYRTMWEILSRN